MNSCVVIISIVYFSISWLVIAWPDLPTRQSLLKVAAVSLPNTGLDCQRNVRKNVYWYHLQLSCSSHSSSRKYRNVCFMYLCVPCYCDQGRF